jgi:hypothetical protein
MNRRISQGFAAWGCGVSWRNLTRGCITAIKNAVKKMPLWMMSVVESRLVSHVQYFFFRGWENPKYRTRTDIIGADWGVLDREWRGERAGSEWLCASTRQNETVSESLDQRSAGLSQSPPRASGQPLAGYVYTHHLLLSPHFPGRATPAQPHCLPSKLMI